MDVQLLFFRNFGVENMSFIRIKNLVHQFHMKDANGEITEIYNAIDDVSMQIEEGQLIAILGRNGSGKSTLARHLNNLLFPDEGAIWIDDIKIRQEDEENVWNNRKKIGMVFQNPDNQIIGTTVEEDTAFGPENIGLESERIKKLVSDALTAVNMEHKKNISPNHLSGGQKQKVAVAGILALKPKCIVLDEATSMLDPQSRKELLKLVMELNKKEKITIIMITHNMEEVTSADKIFVMNKGKLLSQGSSSEIFNNSEIIKEAGLEIPEIMELAIKMHNKNPEFKTGLFTVMEFANEFERVYNDKRKQE